MAKASSGLGDGSFIAATVVINSVTGELVGGPTVSAKGFAEDPEVFEPLVTLITEALDRSAADEITDRTSCSRSCAASSAAGSTTLPPPP